MLVAYGTMIESSQRDKLQKLSTRKLSQNEIIRRGLDLIFKRLEGAKSGK